nr:ammonium transporter [Laribacter hongkongensis]
MMKKAIGILALAGVLGIGTALVLTRSGTPAHVPLVSITTPAPADGTVPIETAAAGTATAAQAAPAAAVPPVPAPKLDTGNTAWMLVSTALVLLMTIPGLALFYGGMVRKKNVLSTLMQSFAICSVVTVLWFMFGYSLAFTPGNGFIGGLDKMFLNGVAIDSLTGTAGANIPETVFVVFQMTFAIITPALIAGAFAERMKFSAMLVFMVLWMFAVYVPVAHWVWEPTGWMFKDGVLDFAGGTVVHINAGVAGLVCALVLGKRVGFGKEAMPPHNLVLTMVGASMLWVGWFGFNAGSALEASGRAGMAMLVTQIAAGTAAVSWMLAEWVMKKKASVLGIVSGAVAGLVAITPAAGFVDPKGALLLGAVAGMVCYWGATGLKHWIGYDDSLDAFGVHGVGGIVGAILTGPLAVVAIGGVEGSIVTQSVAVAATVGYTLVVTFVLLKLVDLLLGLRVSAEEEREGLDLVLHGERVE